MSDSMRARAKSSVASGWAMAIAVAAGWCSAALLAGVTGVLIANGHDGLAFTLGIVAAAFIWAVIVVPMMASAPAASGLPSYLSARAASPATGRIAAIVLLLALAGLLSAEIAAADAVLRLFGQSQLALGIAVGAAAIGCMMAARPGAPPDPDGAVVFVPAVFVVVLAVLLALTYNDGPGALVSIPAMAGITGLEQELLEKRLADPATFKPYSVPFLRTDAANFVSLIVCLAFGLSMLARPRVAASVALPFAASRIAARAVVALTALVILIPPLAAAAKRALLSLVSTGVRPSALPEWLSVDLVNGAVQLCGATSRDTVALAKACGKGVGPQGLVRWHELAFSNDAMLYAALDHASPYAAPLKIAFTLAVVAAALWTARRIGLLAIDAAPALTRVTAAPLLCVVAVLAAASLISFAKPADALTLMTWSATLAAAGLAPAVLSCVLTARQGARSLSAAMIAGSGLTLAMILAPQYAPIEVFNATGMSQTAPPAAVRKLSNLLDTWTASPEGPGKDALRAQARKLARDNLSWLGIKPLSFGIFGLALGLLIALTGGLISSLLGLNKSTKSTASPTKSST